MFSSKQLGDTSWNQLISSRGEMFRWLRESADPRAGRVELVTRNGRPMPVVILRKPEKSFRKPLDNAIPAVVLMDVITVVPFPAPFAYVMPIIFDDALAPYCGHVPLNLFPIDTAFGAPILKLSSGDPLSARKVVRAFCQTPRECGVVVFDPANMIRFAKISECVNLSDERAREIADVMTFLDGFDIRLDYRDCTPPQEIFDKLFCTRIRVPGTEQTVVVPANRSSMLSERHVLSIKLVGDRLLDRRACAEPSNSKDRPAAHDVFVSHAHADSRIAHAIVGWLRTIWPGVRIYITEPEENKKFKEDPEYFIREIRESKCIVHLLTPNSFGRPMVGLEVTGTLKAVVTLIAGLTIEEVRRRLQQNLMCLFFALDLGKTVQFDDEDAGRRLCNLISDATGLQKVAAFVPMPNFTVENVGGQDAADAWRRYVEDMQRIRESARERQTEAEAEKLLDDAIRILADKLGEPRFWDAVFERNARSKLAMCSLWCKDNSDWIDVLQMVPALVDDRLMRIMTLAADGMLASGDLGSGEKLKRMLLVAKDVQAVDQFQRPRAEKNPLVEKATAEFDRLKAKPVKIVTAQGDPFAGGDTLDLNNVFIRDDRLMDLWSVARVGGILAGLISAPVAAGLTGWWWGWCLLAAIVGGVVGRVLAVRVGRILFSASHGQRVVARHPRSLGSALGASACGGLVVSLACAVVAFVAGDGVSAGITLTVGMCVSVAVGCFAVLTPPTKG